MIHSPQSQIVSDASTASRTSQTSAGSRSLVPLRTAIGGARRASPRTSANFLAQLIATAQQSPQTREKRRIEPQAAIAMYRATNAQAGKTGEKSVA